MVKATNISSQEQSTHANQVKNSHHAAITNTDGHKAIHFTVNLE